MIDAKTFGIPTADESNTLFTPAFGSRNSTIGLAILLLNLLGDKEAVSVVLGCTALAGVYDTWFCAKHGGDWVHHAVATPVLTTVSWMLWQ